MYTHSSLSSETIVTFNKVSRPELVELICVQISWSNKGQYTVE